MSKPISIVIADDHALLRGMLEKRLEQEPDMSVVASVSTAQRAVQESHTRKPDMVLLDIEMPGLSAFDAARTIKEISPTSRVIFLSAFVHDHYIEQALQAEASGYITKSEPPEDVIKAIRTVIAGKVYFSTEVQSRIVVDAGSARLAGKVETRSSLLTGRELQVLAYLARGMAKKEIAGTMDISVKTVEQHCTNLMHKLDIHNRVDLARFAIREGLIEA